MTSPLAYWHGFRGGQIELRTVGASLALKNVLLCTFKHGADAWFLLATCLRAGKIAPEYHALHTQARQPLFPAL
jgi:hypothetical protein